jgi:hypothetical protein
MLVISSVDPGDLRINLRYTSNKTLPKVVKDAKANLAADVFEKARSYNPPYDPPTKAIVNLTFTFSSLAFDLDGPLKHTLDALQDGLRMAGHPTWNDRYIWEITLYREIGEPGIIIHMAESPLV